MIPHASEEYETNNETISSDIFQKWFAYRQNKTHDCWRRLLKGTIIVCKISKCQMRLEGFVRRADDAGMVCVKTLWRNKSANTAGNYRKSQDIQEC
jgi:hypothetical protein